MDNDTKAYIAQEIEQLAGIVKSGFDAVDKRFDAVDRQLDAIDKRLIKIENQHDRRLDRLEDDVRVLKTKAGIR